MWTSRAALVLLTLLGLTSAAGARPLDQVTASGSLRVAVYRDFPPYSDEKAHNLRGLDVDLAAEIAKRLGVKVDYMILTAGEQVDDDLRNAVWKGHYMGGGVADLMLHVPLDPLLAQRNDNVVLFAPYFRDVVAVVTDPAQTGGDDLQAAFGEHKVGVEVQGLSDYYLTGAFSGQLRSNVVHFHTVAEAVDAMRKGEVAGVMAQLNEIEGALGKNRGRYHVQRMRTPGLRTPSWTLGMAVKDNSHDLADAIEPIVEGMVKDGSLARLFAKHGLTYNAPSQTQD